MDENNMAVDTENMVETPEQGENSTPEKTPKTYTEQEVQEMLQKEGDKRVSQALKKQEEKRLKEQSEAEKLKSMNETQKREYELTQKIKAFEEREAELNLKENKLEASKILQSKGLPIDFVDHLVANDAETMFKNIEAFEASFKDAVSVAVKAQLAGSAPKSTNSKSTTMSKEEFKSLNALQRSELYKSNPTLYTQLSK